MSTITPDRPATRRTKLRLAQPLLRNGDRYTQPDFHALYEQTPEGFKAELIDGEVQVFEVSYTSASIDLGRKKRAYQRAGIQEYLVWRTEDNELDWWELKEGIYVPLQRNGDGSAESRAFPGLLLDVPALLKRDLSRVLRRVREQLGGAGHLAFIKQLSRKRG